MLGGTNFGVCVYITNALCIDYTNTLLCVPNVHKVETCIISIINCLFLSKLDTRNMVKTCYYLCLNTEIDLTNF